MSVVKSGGRKFEGKHKKSQGQKKTKKAPSKNKSTVSKTEIKRELNVELADLNVFGSEIQKRLEKINLKTDKKTSKSEDITYVITNCFYLSAEKPEILLKKGVLKCLQFCTKYGNDAQRARLRELFELRIDTFLTSLNAKYFVNALFMHSNSKGREFLVKVFEDKVPQVFFSKNLGPVLNQIFSQYLTVKQKYSWITAFFGKHYKIFKMTNPTCSLIDFASDKAFDASFEDIKSTIMHFSNKSLCHYECFHYFLSKLQVMSPKWFNEKILPMLCEFCISEETSQQFVVSHYGCELISRIIHYYHGRQKEFGQYDMCMSKINKMLESNINYVLKYSGGVSLIFTLMNLSEYKEFVLEKVLDPLLNDESFHVSDDSCHYALHLLEVMPIINSPVFDDKKLCFYNFYKSVSSYSNIFTYSDDNILLKSEILQEHCSFIQKRISLHFVANSKLILTDFNYGLVFARWRSLIKKKYIKEIYSNFKLMLENSDEFETIKCNKLVPAIFQKLILVEKHLEIDYVKTVTYLLVNKVSFDAKLLWLESKVGLNILKTLFKNADESEELTSLKNTLVEKHNFKLSE